VQEVSLNPQKLAGQCGKLKCCLNYELAGYAEVQKDLPSRDTLLKTRKGDAVFLKTDIYRGIMWYVYNDDKSQNIYPVPVARVKEIIALNNKGKIPEELISFSKDQVDAIEYKNDVGQDSLTRFEKQSGSRSKRSKRSGKKSRKQG
jgi:cell fate regulator YaaT (PSP1 superfamily)